MDYPSYPASMTHDETGYSVEFLDFHAFTEGDSLEEALFNAREALDVTILGFVQMNQVLPEPTQVQGENIIHVSSSIKLRLS